MAIPLVQVTPNGSCTINTENPAPLSQGHTPDRGHTSSLRPYSYHTAQPYESQDFYNTDNSVQNAAGGGGGEHDVLVQKQGEGHVREADMYFMMLVLRMIFSIIISYFR